MLAVKSVTKHWVIDSESDVSSNSADGMVESERLAGVGGTVGLEMGVEPWVLVATNSTDGGA